MATAVIFLRGLVSPVEFCFRSVLTCFFLSALALEIPWSCCFGVLQVTVPWCTPAILNAEHRFVWAAAESCLVVDATNSETRECSVLLSCSCCVPALHEWNGFVCARERGCFTFPFAFLPSCRWWLFCHGKELSWTITSLFGTVCAPWNCTYHGAQR